MNPQRLELDESFYFFPKHQAQNMQKHHSARVYPHWIIPKIASLVPELTIVPLLRDFENTQSTKERLQYHLFFLCPCATKKSNKCRDRSTMLLKNVTGRVYWHSKAWGQVFWFYKKKYKELKSTWLGHHPQIKPGKHFPNRILVESPSDFFCFFGGVSRLLEDLRSMFFQKKDGRFNKTVRYLTWEVTLPYKQNVRTITCLLGTWKLTLEPRKNPLTFQKHWLVNRDPYNGLL